MNKQEIKKENRKALPKFLILLFFACIVGGIAGYFLASQSTEKLEQLLQVIGFNFGAYVAPAVLVIFVILLPILAAVNLRGAKSLLQQEMTEEEEEIIIQKAEDKLSILLWISSSAMILGFFLIGASYSVMSKSFETETAIFLLPVSIACFMITLIETIVIQQKCVDFVKQLHPEKQGSVYDTKFQKKWWDSCDEAEKIMIGKCAYKSYNATTNTCLVMALLTVLSALFFDTGIFPIFCVNLIWFVQQTVYFLETLKYSKEGNRINN